jgi:hypothetical protein
MKLLVNGTTREFIPLKNYQAQHNLPDDFQVARFEPKDYSGLGSIDGTGNSLNHMRDDLLNHLPASLTPQGWLEHLPKVTARFHHGMTRINDQIKLREFEIEFAAAGFEDMCRTLIYGIIRAGSGTPPTFEVAYEEWLWSTIRVAVAEHPYVFAGEIWRVQVVSHAFGRCGLVVARPNEVDYVLDGSLACPAEGFMITMLSEVCTRILSSASSDKPLQ